MKLVLLVKDYLQKMYFWNAILCGLECPSTISQNSVVAFDRVSIFPPSTHLDIRPQAVQCAPYLLRG